MVYVPTMLAERYLETLRTMPSPEYLAPRLKDWKRSILWVVDGHEIYWTTERGLLERRETLLPKQEKPDITLTTTLETLKKIVEKGFPLFLAFWGTGELRVNGSFGDAFHLGYLFLQDRRKREILFIAHCWLNMNTRFPGGAECEGANLGLSTFLMGQGYGIVQMPCPEQVCLGLEKQEYGKRVGEELRQCFRDLAVSVTRQIKEYVSLGYRVAGVLGMNPSPSCGVESTKGRGTLEGLDADTSEKPGPGLFIEELKALLRQEGLETIPVFGVRRALPSDGGVEGQVEELKRHLSTPDALK